MTLDVASWAGYLLDAADRAVEVASITSQVGTVTAEDAYAVQAALLDLRLARGEVIVGAKLGLTSLAKQRQMGVDEPCYGWVTDRSVLAAGTSSAGGTVPLGELIHPRAEPEIVFTMAGDLAGPDVTAGDVLDATAAVRGGIEVIDSRYVAFSFTFADVVADNTSAARVLLGTTTAGPRAVDLDAEGCTFSVDGDVTGRATGADLLGGPAACVAQLVRHLHRYGRRLEAGWTVLAGAPTDAKALQSGTTVEARYTNLGSVTLTAV